MSEDRVPYVVNPTPAASTPLDLEAIEEALQPTFSGWGEMINGIVIEQSVPLLIAEVKRLRKEVHSGDNIWFMYKQLISELPECPEHGECVPHAVEWIRSKR